MIMAINKSKGITSGEVQAGLAVIFAREQLDKIAAIIEGVEIRCQAADGPVPWTKEEITEEELKEIYKLATAHRRKNVASKLRHKYSDYCLCSVCADTWRKAVIAAIEKSTKEKKRGK